MISTLGWPGAGDGVGLALGVRSGCTPLGSGVGHGSALANQCSVKPLLKLAFIVLPKYVFG